MFALRRLRSCTLPAHMKALLTSAERQLALQDLQHAESLLHLSDRAGLTHENIVLMNSARSNILAALKLLLELPGLPETCTSASELILKAELALASVNSDGMDLSVRVADGLLLQSRVRIEGFAARFADTER